MGMYDTVSCIPEEYDDQFKCWLSEGNRYEKGSKVPDCLGTGNYSILLNSFSEPPLKNLFLVIEDHHIKGVFSEPFREFPLFDKWGASVENLEAPPPNPFKEAMKKVFEEMGKRTGSK